MDRHRRHVQYALAYNALNPFAQITRFADEPEYKRPKLLESQSDLPSSWKMPGLRGVVSDDEEMQNQSETTADTQVATTAFGPRNANPRGGNHETPVIFQRSHFGLPETTTQVFTSSTYFSIISTSSSGNASNLRVRLTSIPDKIASSISGAIVGNPIQPGIYSSGLKTNTPATGSNWTAASTFPFPTTTTDGWQWRSWYIKMYQYYHVMGCEYEFTFQNIAQTPYGGCVVASFIDTYNPIQSTQIHPTDATLSQMEQWPDVTWTRIRSSSEGNTDVSQQTLKGYYYPGKVNQNVENDEDVSTWTSVVSTPTLTENITLRFFPDMFNELGETRLNCRLRMRLIVQLKDLNPVFRWPAAQTAVTLTAPTDILPS